MDVYLCAGTDDKGLLDIISQELTFDGIRTGIGETTDIEDILNSCKNVGLKLILLIPDEKETANPEEDLIAEVTRVRDIIFKNDFNLKNLAIEIVNEPLIFNEFWRENPKQLGHTFNRCIDIIREKLGNITILSPSIPNLGIRDINYLNCMFSTIAKDKIFTVAVHRYPATMDDALAPHKNYSSRDAEIEALKSVIGGRKFCITEMGCPQTHKEKRVFKDKIINISEERQTQYCKKEITYWKNKQVSLIVWYQINDGPAYKEETLDSYGIRHFDLSPKHIWYAMPDLITMAHLN